MGKNWWEFPITQGYGQHGEQGVDLGTPYGTPISSLFEGVVTRADFNPWGGEVDIAVQGGGFLGTEKILHLDTIDVQKGQHVNLSTLLGLSGGQTSGGNHPVTDPRYSTGPHTEIDLVGPRGFTDPTSYVKAGSTTGIDLNPLDAPKGVVDHVISPVADAVAGLPAAIGHGIADAGHALVVDAGVFFKRQLVAMIVALVVLYILFHK